ncbi:mannose-6-phosphate receptor binding domain-containing protein [Syncephalis fuscata]|nr:mannose-6-phosphate receptor binding domain-containing protein [Syncephalis fuscata]
MYSMSMSVGRCLLGLLALSSLIGPSIAASKVPCTVADEKNSKYYDLRPLTKTGSKDWEIDGQDGKFNYRLNVCDEIHYDKTGLSESWNVAAFQITGEKKGFSIGRISKTPVLRDDHIVLVYENGDECGESTSHRTTVISFYCDENASKEAKPKFSASIHSCVYIFNWYTPFACASSTPPSRQKSSSGGSSFFSILSILVFIYLLVGILYKRFVLSARGFEQIPHIDFWRNVVEWCKDIFYVVMAKIRPSRSQNRNYSSLSSDYRRGSGGGIVLGGNSGRRQHGFADRDDDDDDDADAIDVLIADEANEEELLSEGQALQTMGSRNQQPTSPGHSGSERSEHARNTGKKSTSKEGGIRLVDTADEDEDP